MRRKDREISESFAFDLVDQCDWGTLSLIDPSGFPYGVPIQVVRERETIYFHSASKGFKLDCLEKNSNVCLSFVQNVTLISEEFTTKYQSSIVRGEAEEVTDMEEKVRILQVLCQRYAPAHAHLAHTEIATHISATSIYKISVTSATGKEHK